MFKPTLTALVLGMICLSAMSGCIREYRESFGVTGRLLDDATGKPVGDTPIEIIIDEHRFKEVSCHEGCLDIEPKRRLVLWIIGDWAYMPPRIEIFADRYEPFIAKGYFGTPDESGFYPVEGDYMHLGDIRLIRKNMPP